MLQRFLWLSLLAVGLLPAMASAQMPLITRLSAQQNPRGIEWFTVETPHFRIIYPDSLGGEAQRVATLLERYYKPLGASLRAEPERLTVVLNNSNMTSNAVVAWSPRRSEWYAMPNASTDILGPVDWYRLLAAHEGRHVVQERAVRTGWTGLAARIFGDNTAAVLGGTLYYPSWFWEGDAVGTETAFTESGRGRQPSFTARARGLAAADYSYSYYQAFQGSYRTILPDRYEQGYLITSWVRRHYGDSAWSRVIDYAAWNPLPPFAMSWGLKHVTGKSLAEVHRAAIAEADSLWTEQRRRVSETAARVVSPVDESYHVWSRPQYSGDGSVIALYSDLNTVTQLVKLSNGERKVLVSRPALGSDLYFHVQGHKAVWAEYEEDPRYGQQSYYVIKLLDLESGSVKRLTDRTRLFSPALSPDGNTIAAVELSLSRSTSLVLLDAATGERKGSIANKGGTMLSPVWAPDGRSLYFVQVDEARGNALRRVALDGRDTSTVIDFSHQAIAYPVAAGEYLYYSSPASGLDAIWAVDTTSGKRFRVASRRFGARQPAVHPSGSRLIFSDNSSTGYDLAEIDLDASTWQTESQVSVDAVLLADSVVAQERRLSDVSPTDSVTQWPTRPYGGWSRLFDFHSLVLAPAYDGIGTAVMLESRNMLNTFGTSIGAVVSAEEGTVAFEAGASYAGLPVILDGAFRIGSRASTYSDSVELNRGYSWNEQSVTLAARLPLTRVAGLRRQSLVLSAALGITQVSDQPVAFAYENANGRFAPVSYGLSASHFLTAAHRDLQQLGASATIVYAHTPFESPYRGHLFAAKGVVVLPGLMNNHALLLDAGHEEQRRDSYEFSRQVIAARGYGGRYHDTFTRFGVTYRAPLFYPDLALGPIIYARRVQGAVFADVARGEERALAESRRYRSVGVELSTDLALFGTRLTTTYGVRLSRLFDGPRRSRVQFIFQIPQ